MKPESLRAVVELAPGSGTFRVEGASMRPFLRPLDELRIEPLGSRRPRPFELVVFVREGALAAHRVMALRGGRAVLKGDGTRRPGRPVPVSWILGRATARLREGREIRAGSLRWRAESLWSVACSLLRWLR